MLQAWRLWVLFPMRSLDSSIDLNLPAAPWPWVSTQPLTNEYQEFSWGVKGGQHVRLTILLPPMSWLSRRCGSLDLTHPYGPSWPITRRALHFFLSPSQSTKVTVFKNMSSPNFHTNPLHLALSKVVNTEVPTYFENVNPLAQVT
jgi:hypothetical protein